MRISILVCAAVLVAGSVAAQSQVVQLSPSKPTTTINLVSVGFEEAATVLAKSAGVTCEFDASITAEVRNRPTTVRMVRMVNVPLEKMFSLMAEKAGLSIRVIDAKTVRFEKKAP